MTDATDTTDPTPTETRVPDDETPARCPYCSAPFPTDTVRDLHVGRAHDDQWSDDERDAYAEAYEADADDLRRFQYLALAALVLVYFFFLIAYAVFAS